MTRSDLTILYKYMPACRALDLIRTEKIFFPYASQFNDPFDCAIRFEPEIAPEEFVEATYRTSRKDGQNWLSIKTILDKCIKADGTLTNEKRDAILSTANDFKESNARLGVLSLSEDPLSVLMWAHYGKQHLGACVGFERKQDNTLGDDEITHPVEYSDVYPEARFAEITKGDGRLSRKVLYTKAHDWSYEREWRLTCDEGDQLKDVPGRVVRVILGLKMNPENISKFKEECQAKGIPLLQCAIVPGKFRLTTQELPHQ